MKFTKKIFIVLLISIGFNSMAQDGYVKSIEVGGAIGIDKFTKSSFEIEMINGYRFSDYLLLGVGVGFRFTDALYYRGYVASNFYESRDGKYLIPLTFRLKANLTNTEVSPFILGNVGYTFDVGQNPNKNTYGLLIEPAFGVDFKIYEGKSCLYFLVGFNMQSAEYKYFGTSEEIIKGMANSISLRGGVKF